jgi:hypothetical protein
MESPPHDFPIMLFQSMIPLPNHVELSDHPRSVTHTCHVYFILKTIFLISMQVCITFCEIIFL